MQQLKNISKILTEFYYQFCVIILFLINLIIRNLHNFRGNLMASLSDLLSKKLLYDFSYFIVSEIRKILIKN